MASPIPPTRPSASDVAKRFSEWEAEHSALKARHAAQEEKEERLYRQATKEIEAEADKEMSALSATAAVAPSMLPFLERKRDNRLDKLRREYDAKKAEQRDAFEAALQQHFEGYSAFIGLASANQTPASTGVEPNRPKSRQSGPPDPSSPTIPRKSSHPPEPSRDALSTEEKSAGKKPIGQVEANMVAGPDTGFRVERPLDPATLKYPTQPKEAQSKTTPPVAAQPKDTQSKKRAADFQPPSPQVSKKHKGSSDGDSGNASLKSVQKLATKRSISFDEVYQEGMAEYKHKIIEYPPGHDHWYILKCDEHGVHFNLHPLQGGAKHLNSRDHDNMSKEYSQAIALLGYVVFDCDAKMAAKNNAVVEKAFELGYKPFNRKNLTKAERMSLGFDHPPEHAPRRRKSTVPPLEPPSASITNWTAHGPSPLPAHPSNSSSKPPSKSPSKSSKSSPTKFKSSFKPFVGITAPLAGELYLGYWSKNKTRYAVMLLPWGDLSIAGMYGSLATTGLLARAPRCYQINHGTLEIQGWAQGYEDGGPLVSKREFPVMYFDGSRSVGWMQSKDLSLFDFEDPRAHLIPNFKTALDHYAAAQNFYDFADMKMQYEASGIPMKRYSAVGKAPTQAPSDPTNETPTNGSQPNPSESDNTPRPSSSIPNTTTISATNAHQLAVAPARNGNTTTPSHLQHPHTHARLDLDGDVPMSDAGRQQQNPMQDKPRPAEHDFYNNSLNAVPVEKEAQSNGIQNGHGQTAASTKAPNPNPQTAADGKGPQSRRDLPTAPNGKTDTNAIGFKILRLKINSPAEDPKSSGDISQSPKERTNGQLPSTHPLNRGDSSSTSEPSHERRIASTEAPGVAASSGQADRRPGQGATQSPVITSQPGSSFDTGRPAAGAAAGAAGARGSSTPAPASKPSSRASTPFVLRPEDASQAGRWRAVRSEPTPPAQDSASSRRISTVVTAATPVPDDGTRDRASSTQPSWDASSWEVLKAARQAKTEAAESAPKMQERFELTAYRDDQGSVFNKGNDEAPLQLVVDGETKTAAGMVLGVAVKIDPARLAGIVVEPLGKSDTGACQITLTQKAEEGPGKQKMVFETTRAMGREENGRIHARRFVRWLKNVNPGVDYQKIG